MIMEERSSAVAFERSREGAIAQFPLSVFGAPEGDECFAGGFPL